VELAGRARGEVVTAAGVRLVADLAFDEVGGAVDTLLVPGAVVAGPGGEAARVDGDVVAWVAAVAARARRVVAVCAGAHLLAAAGLLDGRTATTHWSAAAGLAAGHPEVTVDPDPIFVRCGDVWTGAGISSGIDLALALVAEDLGDRVAQAVARQLVVYLRRPSGQSQVSVPLSHPPAARQGVDELRVFIVDHLDGDLSTPALAARMCLSERHFARVFRQETGTTPGAYVEAARVEAARRLLESTDRSLEQVAADCGLGSVETLHRALRKRAGTTPAAYRRRFRAGA
ncbi:GlxA family transcriptional regulator, partial [Kitasatospora setae]